MKKLSLLLLLGILLIGLCACGGDVSNVQIDVYPSEIYSEEEIQAAIDVAIDYFKHEFSGCTLTKISYAGDKKSSEYIEWTEKPDADEVIVLTSSFDVDSSGGDGSLNPDSTYDNWLWILTRSSNGEWEHADHGY